jgi:hypothetical protein
MVGALRGMLKADVLKKNFVAEEVEIIEKTALRGIFLSLGQI